MNIWIALVGCIVFSSAKAEELEVVCGPDFPKCTFKGINQSSPSETYKFQAPNPSTLELFTVKQSTIPSWTTRVCNQFPELQEIYLYEIKIAKISPTAFENCNEVIMLALQNNEIKTIEDGTFLHMKNLERLGLFNNQLKYISKDMFKGLLKLTYLNIDSNMLFEVDVHGLKENTPNLNWLLLNENNLYCESPLLDDVVNTVDKDERTLYAGTSEEDKEWHCLSKQQWTDEFNKLDLADQEQICATVSAVKNSDLIQVCNQRLNPTGYIIIVAPVVL